jgi:GTP pyrophosphokinase
MTLSSEMEMPASCLLAALLQDSAKNELEIAEINDHFTTDIAGLVSQLKRIAGLHTERISIQAENFIQLVLTITNDIRVILIRLADRLVLMRNIDTFPVDAQRKISMETINLYIPLAHRLGLYKIKAELEELAMQHVYPEIYRSIADKIEQSKESQAKYIAGFLKPIEKELQKSPLKYFIKSRTKSIPSIWNKMKTQNIEFEQVYDFFAIRIITDSEPETEKHDCWEVYSIVTDIYKPNASRMRDWISSPKSSGYESLHATVAGPGNKWVEVQIRSKRMDEDAEKGQAAHWKYKSDAHSANEADQRLRNIRSILENYTLFDSDSETETQIQPFDKHVYIFTPQGDLKKLSTGATLLDFAFEIHTNVGHHCTGGKVNKSFVPLKHILRTGDQVEIITSKNQHPTKDWLNIATTSKAINKIRRHLKEEEFQQANIGRDILSRKLNQLKINNTDEAIHKLVTHFKAANSLDLFHDIATERIDIQKIKDILLASPKPDEPKIVEKQPEKKNKKPVASQSRALVIINNETPLSDVRLARCCHPVLGDEIFGFVTVSEGIKIHRKDCTNAHEMHTRYHYRVVEARWADNAELSNFLAIIKVTGNDRVGILSSITSVLSDELNANTRSINIESRNGKFEGMITINVSGKNHLEMIIARLLKVKDVSRVSRIS